MDDDNVDELAKKVVEVCNSVTSTMLEKATPDDIHSLQSFTIQSLDSKVNTDSDIEQYQLLTIRGKAIDNRMSFLDLMCFPVLFPTEKFGQFHPRSVRLSPSEYVKSHLLNKDSRYRLSHPFIFYNFWQKELRDLNAGIYNIMRSTSSARMTATALLTRVNSNDKELESNLNTMFQTMRGTKQYWYFRKSEMNCMIQEYGSPMFFLIFSCAKYSSIDIDSI